MLYKRCIANFPAKGSLEELGRHYMFCHVGKIVYQWVPREDIWAISVAKNPRKNRLKFGEWGSSKNYKRSTL
jgi:hypothetical protein